MPALGKELERQYTPDDLAMKEVDSYVERIEKQTERHNPDDTKSQQSLQPVVAAQKPASQSVGVIVVKPNIVLPLQEQEISLGLRSGVVSGVKWLAEWCIMMIKKYPGRVFYLPIKQR